MISLNQETQTESSPKNINQTSFRMHTLFHVAKSQIPSPPCSLVFVTLSHEIRAEWLPSSPPFQRKAPHIEFITFTQAFGSMKEEHQKVDIPEMNVFIKSSRPAKDSVLTVQELNFALTCWIRGWQIWRDRFFEERGTPKYRIGREAQVIPVEAWIVAISSSVNPKQRSSFFWN